MEIHTYVRASVSVLNIKKVIEGNKEINLIYYREDEELKKKRKVQNKRFSTDKGLFYRISIR